MLHFDTLKQNPIYDKIFNYTCYLQLSASQVGWYNT